MSNHNYHYTAPLQGKPSSVNGQPVRNVPTPQQYAQAPPQSPRRPSQQHQFYQPAAQYQQPAYELHPAQMEQPQQSYGPRSSDIDAPVAPALPPRPAGIPNRLMAHSTLSFPPPPRSPNRPPDLPPRPQPANPGATNGYRPYQPSPGPLAAHNPAPPQQQHIAFPTTVPHSHTRVAPEQTYFPPPPPGPPPPAQPVTSTYAMSHAPTAQPSIAQAEPFISPPPPPPPPYTGPERAPVKKQTPPPRQAPSTPGTSYAYTYKTAGHELSATAPLSLLQSTPQIHVQDTSTPSAGTVGADKDDINGLQSMVERLKLRQVSGDASISHVDTASPHVKSAPSPAEEPSQSTSARPLPDCVSQVGNAASVAPPTVPMPAAGPTFLPTQIYLNQSEKARHASPVLSPSLPTCAPLLEESTVPGQSAGHNGHGFPQQSAENVEQHSAQPPQPAATIANPSSVNAAEAFRNSTTTPPFRPVVHCIDTPVSFPTWWYYHSSAPDYPICSKCYMDHIYPTPFRNDFEGRYTGDGVERRCRFNVPRITKQLLPDAVLRRAIDSVVLFMVQRMHIADCRGVSGALGSEGVKWYAVKNNQLPGFLACEACYQDIVCMSQFAFNFEESTGQAKSDSWACDICVPFIRKEFELRTALDDWPSFLNEAKARIGMPACPKNTPIAFGNRKWFVPVKGQGPPDAVLCVSCYCDFILKSGQEMLWEQDKQDISRAAKATNTCMMSMFHLRTALSAADENKEWPLFWSTLTSIAYHEKPCSADGITDGNWYTLPSQPAGYNVCGACYAGIVQSLHLDQFFVVRTSKAPAAGEPHLCALNIKSQRFASYIRLMLQTWFTADCTAWDVFASRCAAVPMCPRNTDYKNRAWFGWPECVICADCYTDVVHGTVLDTPEMMAFYKPTILESPHICEMYSPRMRKLYQEACQAHPLSTAALFQYVEQRRLVYWQTIPRCRQILAEEKFLANKISMARTSSVFYNAVGGTAAIGHNNHYTYGAAGVGYNYANSLQLTGAQYNAQANAMSIQLGGSKILLVGQLEQQWLAIE